jgi:hypothetical protein
VWWMWLACSLVVLVVLARYVGATRTAGNWVQRLEGAAASVPNGMVIVDGRIAASARPIHGEFVSFVEERFRTSGGRSSTRSWRVERMENGVFDVDTATARLAVVNTNYAHSPWWNLWPLSESGHLGAEMPIFADWDHAGNRRMTGEIERLRGLVPGQPVVIVGRMAGTTQIEARYVVAGPPAHRLAEARRVASGADNRLEYWICMGFALSGVVLLIWTMWTPRRRKSEA